MRHVTFILTMLLATTTWSRAEHFQVGGLPDDAPAGFSQFFTKHVDVLGLHVYANAQTPDTKVLHTANILAQWIDNDEDGTPDDAVVHQKLLSLHASMIMWNTENQFENSGFEETIPDDVFDTTVLQLQFGLETNPGYPGNQQFDATLEETLHLVTWGGYSRVYPSVFGEFSGSQIANAMDANIANGFYHYDDPTCDYECLVTEYHYWALTSMLGAQDYSWRNPEIMGEWELYSPSLVEQNDPAVHALMSDPQWSFATVLPDGNYVPHENSCPADLDDNGSVDVNDVLLILAAFNTPGPSGDLNNDGTVDVTDILILLAAYGNCP